MQPQNLNTGDNFWQIMEKDNIIFTDFVLDIFVVFYRQLYHGLYIGVYFAEALFPDRRRNIAGVKKDVCSHCAQITDSIFDSILNAGII